MNDTTALRQIVITGASRGLGLELARQWLAGGHRVAALARRPADSPGLTALRRAHEQTLRVESCDVADDASVTQAARGIERAWDRVDVLVNNAGVYGQRGDSLASADFGEIRRVFEINALGPLRVTRALLPLLQLGMGARVAHLTSLMGSISDNGSGGAYGYRISKASLNMISRNLARELSPAGIISVVLHPGWVRTDMGGPGGRLDVDESARGLIRVIESRTPSDSGGFFDYTGRAVPW